MGVECNNNDFIYTSTAKIRIGLNHACGQPLADKRLRMACKLSEEANQKLLGHEETNEKCN